MAHTDASDDDDPIIRLRDLTTDQRTVMLATPAAGERSGTRLEARPLTVLETDDDGAVWFLVSLSSDWVRNLGTAHPAIATGSNDGDGSWFAASGAVRVVGDRSRIEALWNPVAGAWFSGPDDPDLAALCLDTDELSWWDSPSSGIVRLWKIAKAALGGDPDDVGDHATETISTPPH